MELIVNSTLYDPSGNLTEYLGDGKESFDLKEAEEEANEFMNQLNQPEIMTSEKKTDFQVTVDDTSGEKHINVDSDMKTKVGHPVQRNSSLQVARKDLFQQTSSLSRSVNDLTSMNAYRPTASLNNNNYQINRFGYHDDLDSSDHKKSPLCLPNHREVSKQSSLPAEEKSNLNELQQRYSQAIHDFKLLRSTLTENMERNLLRTEQIDQLNNNDRQHGTASAGNLERLKRDFSPLYRSQDNIFHSSVITD